MKGNSMYLLGVFLLYVFPLGTWALPFFDGASWKSLPLQSLHVQGEFFDSLGEVIIRQIWTNNEKVSITSKYKFSLDTSAVVSGFQMKIGNQKWVGTVKAKDTARSEFNNAVASGVKSSLLEKISDNEYQVEIGPIPPSETAEIEFHYLTHAAVQLDGSYRFVLPTNIAQKYLASRQANQADKEYAQKMVSTPYSSQPPYTFDVDLIWRTGSALRGIVSATNEIQTELLSTTTVRVRCTTAPEHGDFSLLVTTASTTGAYSYENEEGTTFLYVHNQIPSEAMPSHTGKKITVVLDRSGSMHGQKMREAVEAVDKFLSLLPVNEATLVNIVSFGSQFRALYSNAVPATAGNIQAMRASVRDFQSDFGGTELLECLRAVISGQALPASVNAPTFDSSNMEHVIVLLTDGQISNLNAVVDLLKNNANYFRIMSVGIGRDADRKLVQQVADATHGLSRMLVDETDLSRALTDILAYIDKQYYTDVRVLDYEASQCSQVLYPAHPVDMFLRLSPEQFRKVAASGLTITAKDPVHRGSMKIWHLPVADTIKTGRLLEKLYADHTISQLSKQIEKMSGLFNVQHDIAHLTESIVALSVKHGIMNKHTSFLVISDTKVSPQQLAQVQHVEVPQHGESVTTGANVRGGRVHAFAKVHSFASDLHSGAGDWLSSQPSSQPSMQPSAQPSSLPSAQPSAQPAGQPSMLPSVVPSAVPSAMPAGQPSVGHSARGHAVHPTSMPTAEPTGSAGPSVNAYTVSSADTLSTAEVAQDGSAMNDLFDRRAGVNTDPNHPNAPSRVTLRILVALQQSDGSLLYTPHAYLLLQYSTLAQLEAAAAALGLTPELFFNAAMLVKFEATRVGEEGETERLLLSSYVTRHVSAQFLVQLAASLGV